MLFAVTVLLALAAFSGPAALAQTETAAPQLPILLLNGAIYTQEYDLEGLPPSFRVDEYAPQVTALYMVQCEGPIKEVWVEDLRSIGENHAAICPTTHCWWGWTAMPVPAWASWVLRPGTASINRTSRYLRRCSYACRRGAT